MGGTIPEIDQCLNCGSIKVDPDQECSLCGSQEVQCWRCLGDGACIGELKCFYCGGSGKVVED